MKAKCIQCTHWFFGVEGPDVCDARLPIKRVDVYPLPFDFSMS
jgi:hypothetical protein